MTKGIEIHKARIVEARHNLSRASAGAVPITLKLVAPMTPAIAAQMQARTLLYDPAKDVKLGYAEVVLDLEMKNLRVKFQAAKIDPLDLYADVANKFKVYTKGDDGKKGKRLLVSFQIHLVGSPFNLIEYLLKVGGIEGTCTIQPRQEELPLTDVKASTVTKDLIVDTFERAGITARIETRAMPDGNFSMTRCAASNTKKLPQAPPEYFASENEARAAGAVAIERWATRTKADKNTPKVKVALAALIEFCAKLSAGSSPKLFAIPLATKETEDVVQ